MTLITFEDVDALLHLPEPELRAPRDGRDAELHPLAHELGDVLAYGPPVEAQRHQIHREVLLHAGVGQHEAHELVGILARGARLQHEPQLVLLVRFVVHLFEHAEHGLLEIVLRRRDLAALVLGPRVGEGLELGHHALDRGRGRQLVHHHLPLPAREVLDLPACAGAQ
jgi:hypothetical protein